MTDAQVQQVIDDLLNGLLLDNWHFFAITFAVTLIGAACGSFIKAFFYERGKLSAIKRELNIITEQVRVTTDTSEKIKTALDHDNWRKKEIEVLKRLKLEEYYLLLLALKQNVFEKLESLLSHSTYEASHYDIGKLSLTQALYLPEIYAEHKALSTSIQKYNVWAIEDRVFPIQGETISKSSKVAASVEVLQAISNPLRDVEKKIHQVSIELNQ